MPSAALIYCVVSTFLWARIVAQFAKMAARKTLNRTTGVILGLVILCMEYLVK